MFIQQNIKQNYYERMMFPKPKNVEIIINNYF